MATKVTFSLMNDFNISNISVFKKLLSFYSFYFNPFLSFKVFCFLFYFLLCVYGSQFPVFLLRRVPFGHLGFLLFVFLELEDELEDLDDDFDFLLDGDFFEEELDEATLGSNCKGEPGLSSSFFDDTGVIALDLGLAFSKPINSLDISELYLSYVVVL